MIVCSFVGCKCEATHIPKINVPAMGHAIGSHEPIGMCLNLKLCHDHALAFSSADQFSPAAPGAMRDIIKALAAGRAPPDFARAFTTAVPLDAEEALVLDRARRAPH